MNTNPTPIPVVALLTSREVAARLRVTERTVYSLRKRGLRCVRVGDAIRFDPTDVDDFIEANREQGGGQ